ncbi:hypothetical protein I3760_10G112400 [Carya illinoinensis]|nr:hypothetical protein I3760_10G112400 [Carya illinoinensis]
MLLFARLATAIVIEDVYFIVDWKHACLRSQEGVESPQRPTRYSKATSRHPV